MCAKFQPDNDEHSNRFKNTTLKFFMNKRNRSEQAGARVRIGHHKGYFLDTSREKISPTKVSLALGLK